MNRSIACHTDEERSDMTITRQNVSLGVWGIPQDARLAYPAVQFNWDGAFVSCSDASVHDRPSTPIPTSPAYRDAISDRLRGYRNTD